MARKTTTMKVRTSKYKRAKELQEYYRSNGIIKTLEACYDEITLQEGDFNMQKNDNGWWSL